MGTWIVDPILSYSNVENSKSDKSNCSEQAKSKDLLRSVLPDKVTALRIDSVEQRKHF